MPDAHNTARTPEPHNWQCSRCGTIHYWTTEHCPCELEMTEDE